MKRLYFIIIVGTVLLLLNSCYEPIPGSGNVIRWEVNFGTINSVSLLSIGKIYVTAGSPQKVEIEVDDNFENDIELDVGYKKLEISTKRDIGPSEFNVYITIADIAELINKGSGKIIVQNSFNQGSQLWLTLRGSGNIEINDFIASECIAFNSGSGNIKAVSGSINSGEYSLTESGKIDFSTVVNKDVEAKNSGSGKILFTVTDKLDATISGSGNIEYWGNPANITEKNTGTGQLIKRN